MIRRAVLVGVTAIIGLGGCEASPRSAEYFAARPEEAARVVADCASGAHRGEECVNARAAQIEADRSARIEAYRRQRQAS